MDPYKHLLYKYYGNWVIPNPKDFAFAYHSRYVYSVYYTPTAGSTYYINRGNSAGPTITVPCRTV